MSTPLLLEHLIDDAALFPPGNAPMAAAVGAHRAVKLGPLGWLVGRFLCPASRIAQLRAELRPADAIALAVVGDTGAAGLPVALAAVGEDPRLSLLAVELAPPTGADLVTSVREVLDILPDGVRGYVELPRQPDWRAALAVVAAAGRGAKLRTGGTVAAAFPSEREVAEFLVACSVAAVPFKCTAGLHHAVRHTDPATGFEHHGFLNVALAVCAVVQGEDAGPALAQRDPAVLAAAANALDEATVIAARALYAGFGSCSVAEPAADLLELGLLA